MARVIKRENLCINGICNDENLFSALNGKKEDGILLSKELIKRTKYGDESAYYDIGIKYYKAKNYTKALHWIQKAAAKNYSYAQKQIGAMYKNGEGVPKDYKLAMTWYLKAVDNNQNKHAQFWIGNMYEKGLGVTKNIHTAIEWYTKAAKQGLPLAQYHLSGLFAHEEQVNDLQKAVNWSQKAFDSGYKYLLPTIERLNAQGYYAQDKSNGKYSFGAIELPKKKEFKEGSKAVLTQSKTIANFHSINGEESLLTTVDSLDLSKSGDWLNDTSISNIYEQHNPHLSNQEESDKLKLVEEKLKALENSFRANLQQEKAEKALLQKRLDTIEQSYVKKEELIQRRLDDMQHKLHVMGKGKPDNNEQMQQDIGEVRTINYESEKARYEREKARYEMGKAKYEREKAKYEMEKVKYNMENSTEQPNERS